MITAILGSADARPINFALAFKEINIYEQSLNQTLVFTQTPSYSYGISQKYLFQGLFFTQLVERQLIKVVSVSHTLSFSQTVNGVQSRNVTQTLALSQSQTATLVKRVLHTLNFNSMPSRNIVVNKDLHQIFQPYQTILTGPNTFGRTVTQNLTFVQQAIGYAPKFVNQTLVFTQAASCIVTKEVRQILNFTQDIQVNLVINRTVSQMLIFDDTIQLHKVKFVNVAHALGFSQIVKKIKVFPRTLTQALTLNQSIFQTAYNKLLTQTLTFTQIPSGFKVTPQSLDQTLQFNQLIGLTKVTNRTITQTLNFINGVTKQSSLGDVDIPGAQGYLVRQQIMLQGDDLVIILPRPEFNDNESFQGELTIKRTRNGKKRIYKQTTDKYIINYDFILSRAKALELKNFIVRYNSKQFKMLNWKGESWIVIFKSNPFTITEAGFWGSDDACGGKFDISLEFEGIRIN